MSCDCRYLPGAEKDLSRFTPSVRAQVLKGLREVCENPLPASESGYGKPLSNGAHAQLAGLYKVKFRGIGVCVVYKLVRTYHEVVVIVVGVREQDEVYRIAGRRLGKHGL